MKPGLSRNALSQFDNRMAMVSFGAHERVSAVESNARPLALPVSDGDAMQIMGVQYGDPKELERRLAEIGWIMRFTFRAP